MGLGEARGRAVRLGEGRVEALNALPRREQEGALDGADGTLERRGAGPAA
ncbi:hypothetical protein [Methylobacterium gregans]